MRTSDHCLIVGLWVLSSFLAGCTSNAHVETLARLGIPDQRAAEDLLPSSNSFSWNTIVRVRMDVRGLALNYTSDGSYHVTGSVVNTDGGMIQDPHEIDLFIRLYPSDADFEAKTNVIWTSPVWHYRAEVNGTTPIDNRATSPVIRDNYWRIRAAGATVYRTDNQ